MTGRAARNAARSIGERGLTLLECAAALAIAALVLASTTHVSQAAALLVRRARVEAEMVDMARNLLEHELGAPCAASLECAADYHCAVTRAPVTATADRIVVRVTRDDDALTEELATLAPAPACGG